MTITTARLFSVSLLLLASTSLTGCGLALRSSGPPPPPLLDPTGPRVTMTAPDTFKVLLETTKGDVVIRVDRSLAPIGADRFYNLVRNGFYDGTHFFRNIAGFVAQFGINPDPRLTEAWKTARIDDDSVRASNVRGSITFATAGPNTRTVQLFINHVDNSRLDPMGFAPFGQVIGGMDTVDRLYTGYGEGAPRGRGPTQERIEAEGGAYLDEEFPLLDKIVRARVLDDPQPLTPPPARRR
jgi:peptidyl-prolyl cis-trans isomerase A (cyclophilin A)